MREKYIKFFKKEMVFLLILLIVICFSFGLTYSNFVYHSDSYRAVEMFTSKLKYELSNSKLTIKPGNNLYKINIKSLNNVDSYYKIIYDNNVDIEYYNNDTNIISSNGSKDINLVVFNSSNENKIVNLDVVGGYITNTYDDIKIDKNTHVVNKNISIGDVVVFNNNTYYLLNIDNDGNYELLSEVKEDILNIEGSNGYNQYINLANENTINDELISSRALSIKDIERYTTNKIVEYDAYNYYSDAYYPALWAMEEESIIENNNIEAFFNSSEGTCNGNYEQAKSIIVKDIVVNTPIFINEKYRDIFMNSNYLLSTRYQHALSNIAQWGILSIDNKDIKQNKLFESNMKDYKVSGKIRTLTNISNKIDLF